MSFLMDNPIIRREVLSSLRTKKAIVMQAMFLLVVAGLVALYWPAGGLQDIKGDQSKQIFSILAIGQLVMVALFAPAFTSAALTTEKEHGTFESVFSTALRPWEIALGKMVGSLAFLLVLTLSGLPALAAPLLLGGVPMNQVLQALAVLVVTAVYLGMIGLLISAFMHRSYRSIIVTYAVLLLVVFFFALPAWPVSYDLIHRTGSGVFHNVMHVLVSFSPLQAMLSVVWQDQSVFTKGAEGMPPFWMLYLPQAMLVTLVAAGYCFRQLHQPIAPPRPREKLKIVERGKITARSVFFLIDPRKRKANISWWQNPVLIKEFRTRPMLQAQWLMRAVGVVLISSILLILLISISVSAIAGESDKMFDNMTVAIGALIVVLVVIIGPAMSGGTICGDVETGVWDLMRTTRLSSWRIVSGKFQAAVIPMLLLVIAVVPALVIMLYFDLSKWLQILNVLSIVGMTVLFVATAGMFFSSIFLRTSTATAWTYSLVIAVGLLALLVMLGSDRFSERFVNYVYMINPVAAVLSEAGHPALKKFSLLGPHLKIMGTAVAAMVAVTIVRVFQLRRAA